jgi:AraC family transcriptional regulator of adaptative response/methylated-DNA-[protein]-cysteine methyltransferase
MSSDYDRIEQAIHFLAARVDQQPSLSEVAGHLGLSEHHFQRMFKRWAGVTPKDFLQHLTLLQAKRLLSGRVSMLETSLEVGLSGTGRLHDLFLSHEAMTPGEFKRGAAGIAIAWGFHPTPFGTALFAVTERGLCGLSFVPGGEEGEAIATLKARWPGASFREDPARSAPVAAEVTARMQGEARGPLSLLLNGTPFQVKVWEALLAIPEGDVMTYGDLAVAAGAPGASRAVGTALASNPIGYLIPCHRVIRATGAIGEYRWGSARKQAMLALEASRHANGLQVG